VVVVDDNIENFVVEQSVEHEVERLKKLGKDDYMRRHLSFRSKQPALGSPAFEFSDETELERFVRGAVLGKGQAIACKVRQVLADAEVTSVRELTSLLKDDTSGTCKLNTRLKAAGKKGMMKNHVETLRQQVDKPLPARLIFVKQSKRKQVKPSKYKSMPELAELICRADEEMKIQGANLWAISPSQNHYWMHSFGKAMRERATKTGVFCDFSMTLGLVFGAFFGFRVLRDPRRYTRYGQVKDDVERSLRYWHCDGAIIRYTRYAAVKNYRQLVGKFSAKKGGISAGSCAEKHEAESKRALVGMLDEFASSYARLAKPGEPSSCGLIWRQEAPKDLKRKARPSSCPTAAPPGSGKQSEKAASLDSQPRRRYKRWRSGVFEAVGGADQAAEHRSTCSDAESAMALRFDDGRGGGVFKESPIIQERHSDMTITCTTPSAEMTSKQDA